MVTHHSFSASMEATRSALKLAILRVPTDLRFVNIYTTLKDAGSMRPPMPKIRFSNPVLAILKTLLAKARQSPLRVLFARRSQAQPSMVLVLVLPCPFLALQQ